MSFFVSNSKKIKSLFVGFMIPLFMLSLSLPMFANLPDNEVEGTLNTFAPFTNIGLQSANGTTSSSISIVQVFENVPINFGEYKIYTFNYQNSNPGTGITINPQLTPYNFTIFSTAEITLTKKSNLYICNGGYLKDSSGYTQYNFITPTISVNNNSSNVSIPISVTNSFTYTGNVEQSYSWIYPNADGSNYILGASANSNENTLTINSTSELYFNVYTDLEPGTYRIVYNYMIPSWPFHFASGIYINSDPVPTGDANIDFDNGLISFQDASQQIRDEMNEVLNNPDSTDFEKQFAVQVADQKLDQLKDASDAKYNTIVQNFNDDAEGVVNSFIDSGSTEPVQYINNLNRLYTDALTQAVTPEQGTYINTQYNLSLSQMQLAFDANYKAELDEVISDEEMADKEAAQDEIREKLEEQEAAYKAFEESDYKSQLLFEMWSSQLSNSNVYRSIFEYLIEDTNSVFRLYIQVPLALALVSILLATTTVVIRRSAK